MTTNSSKHSRIGAVILAAGTSSRLGTPKQLLRYQGQTLLEQTIHTALKAELSPLMVVLGAHANQINGQINLSKCTVVHNLDWNKGMGGSIACGIRALPDTALDGVFILLCDQLKLSTEHLLNMRSTFNPHTRIVQSHYGTAAGPPVLFGKEYFAALSDLDGKKGAHAIISANEHTCSTVSFPGGIEDVDTIADCQRHMIEFPVNNLQAKPDTLH